MVRSIHVVEVSTVPDDASEDRATVKAIAKDAFPTLQAQLVHLSPHVLMARHEGEIVGGTINEIFEPTPGTQVGLVTWIFTKREARGLHAGEALLEETLEYLEAQGCDTIIAIVRWNNTSSNKLFASHGFSRTTTRDALEALGTVGTVKSFWTAMYWPALGFDLWSTGIRETARTDAGPSPLRALESLAATTVLFLITAVSLFGVDSVGGSLAVVLAVPVGFFAIRWLPRWLATVTDEESWVHWPWGQVYPFTLVLSALGLFVQLPGSRVPNEQLWTYREKLPRLGPAATVSGALMLVTYAVGLFHGQLESISLPATTARSIVYVGWFFVATDVLLIGFPFNTYGARTVFDWNRYVWLGLALTAVALFGVAIVRVLPLG